MWPGAKNAPVLLTFPPSSIQWVIQSKLSPGDKLFLVEMANTYVPTTELADPREEIMQALAEIETTWGDKLREEGRREGVLDGKREILLHMLTLKFGPLPTDVVQRIQAIANEKSLKEVSQQLLQAESLADLKLPTPSTAKKRRA
jgi:predicted transposase YdaD